MWKYRFFRSLLWSIYDQRAKAFVFFQVPADGVLISGHSLAIDESSMTGESKIVSWLDLLA